MTRMIKPGQTIGIIGGGQLGRMMAMAAKQMGYRIAVLEPGQDSPCGQVADYVIEAPYDDREAAKKLAKISDVITYEFENIDSETATWLTEEADFPQGADVLRFTQHRLLEKETIQSVGIPVAPFHAIHSIEDVEGAIEEIGFPAVLKTCRGGYDGKGQRVVKDEKQLTEAASELLNQSECVLEAWIPFSLELSVIVTRSRNGETAVFPVAENDHKDNILHRSYVPARVNDQVIEEAKRIALTLVTELNVVGTLAVELFMLEDGRLYVNELAPRPHNSGHYSIEACVTSQFEQHIRAVCGLPLGSTDLLRPVIMENILGEHVEMIMQGLPKLSEAKLHLYGKAEAKEKRKMGHLTVTAESLEEAERQLERVMKE
ncbi:5-(carboxyamino)imidazole ribonucleotide synthase [Halalkalibacter hemicellulosilyticus]|uniref:N5-carboxyaminoimidazole ribonucleotide synthase n=1 Tax=Halalkalibacter hemicellulosilyticusJCM 9152 TaxID=1236971 RepID=W4QCU0_9BACI|nr:5-(carboxyamino)imidazole ribonucleotide synthase [Halalkalibacter hemicellulosilyticus]GAE29478.1 phosphoribosylaminoimidazole carboxylase ATPase subunit [Halalkalibacter hemicellulosilyticusJCM 9152]